MRPTLTSSLVALVLVSSACGDDPGTAVAETSAALTSQSDRGDSSPRACGQIDEFSIPPGPQGNIFPQQIVTGSDGNLWFATFAPFLGRVSPRDGTVSLVPIPVSTARILVAGPDGNLWFGTGTGLASVSPRGDHALREIALPGFGQVIDLAAGPAAIWALGFGNIARVTPRGDVTLFPIPTPEFSSSDDHMAFDRRGNIWYSAGIRMLHRLTRDGVVTDFPVDGTGQIYGLALGPDGAMWFTQQGGDPGANRIGRITQDGVVSTVVQLPDSDAPFPSAPSNMPLELTAGPDGKMYFTTYLVNPLNYIGQVSRNGALTKFDIPTAGAASFGITTGPDGNIWFTENFNSLVGRLEIDGCRARQGDDDQ